MQKTWYVCFNLPTLYLFTHFFPINCLLRAHKVPFLFHFERESTHWTVWNLKYLDVTKIRINLFDTSMRKWMKIKRCIFFIYFIIKKTFQNIQKLHELSATSILIKNKAQMWLEFTVPSRRPWWTLLRIVYHRCIRYWIALPLWQIRLLHTQVV